MRSLQFVMPLACILVGCQAVSGLSELDADRAADAGVARAPRNGLRVVTGRADRPDASHGPQAVDSGVRAGAPAADAAVGVKSSAPKRAEAGQGAVAGSATGGAGASGSNAAGASAKVEDAGADSDAAVAEMLGNTGLRVSDILGYYSGDWGQMMLRKNGSEIWGVYEHRDGTLIGELNGEGVFVGWWTQLPSRMGLDAGEVEFRWSRIANGAAIALDGRWRYGIDGDWLENWDITRVTDRSAPSQLSDRFERSDDFKRRP